MFYDFPMNSNQGHCFSNQNAFKHIRNVKIIEMAAISIDIDNEIIENKISIFVKKLIFLFFNVFV